jgi:hypothetical protein
VADAELDISLFPKDDISSLASRGFFGFFAGLAYYSPQRDGNVQIVSYRSQIIDTINPTTISQWFSHEQKKSIEQLRIRS